MGQLGRSMAKVRRDLVLTPQIEAALDNGATEGALVDPLVFHDKLMPQMTGLPASRTKRFSPSAIAQCHRRQVLQYLGVSPDFLPKNQLKLVFSDGHWRHLRWQAFLLMVGAIDDIEVKASREDLRFGGSIDGIHTERKYIVEIKGTSRMALVRKGPFDEHLQQAHAYLLLHPEAEKVCFLYEDKSSQEYLEHIVERSESELEQLLETIGELNHAIDEQELPAMLPQCEEETGATYQSCPFRANCRRYDWEAAVLATPRRRRLRIIDDRD